MNAAAPADAATRMLFAPVIVEVQHLPPWAHSEPEWVRLGLIRADVLRAARLATLRAHGIHAYTGLVRAAIVAPAPLVPVLAGACADRRTAAAPTDVPLPLLGAAFLQEKRRLSDLPLFLQYLATAGADDPEDLYDLTSLWGTPEQRVRAMMRVCESAGAPVADLALELLAAPHMRGFAREVLGDLQRTLDKRGTPELIDAFAARFARK